MNRLRHLTTRSIPVGLLFLLSVFLLLNTRVAWADLYTDHVLSIEWLIDSSDAIYLAQFEKSPKDSLAIKTVQKFPEGEPGSKFNPQETLQRVQHWLAPPQAGEQWLLFARKEKYRHSFKVFHGVNLSKPLKDYRSAAMTCKGKPLANRSAILKLAAARFHSKRRLPAEVDRKAVDRIAKDWEWATNYKNLLEGNFNAYTGGTLVKIDCNAWDNIDSPYNQDTLLTHAVIPVEPEHHEKILAAIAAGGETFKQSEFAYPILALVNFPGEKTEACLYQLIEEARDKKQKWGVSQVYHAQALLRYFHYHLEPSEPQNKQLIGRWRIECHIEGHLELIDFTFTSNHTFVASAFTYPRSEEEGSKHLWDGMGYWKVHNGKLSIMQTHQREKFRWRSYRRDIFRQKNIKQITPTEVILENGPSMKRR